MFKNVILLIILISLSHAKDFCSLTLNYSRSEVPLFPKENSKLASVNQILKAELHPYFIYPEGSNSKTQVLRIPSEEQLVASCPGMRNNFKKGKDKLKELSCKKDELFLERKKSTSDDIVCRGRPMGSIMHTKIKCHGVEEGLFHIVGWKISEDWFIPEILVCWDVTKETTLYTRHIIYGEYLKHRVASPGRPTFKKGRLFSENIREFYTLKSQREHIAPMLGGAPKVPGSRPYFFARGHLAPDADFVIPAEQDLTYFYSNAIPQFQQFNNGKWKRIENSIRELARKRKRSLIIFTGTFGTLTLKDGNGNNVPIYLYPEKHLYPVPLILWKVIYDPVAKEAAAIQGLNSVSDEGDNRQVLLDICEDICDQLKWIDKDSSENERRSTTLCCSWKTFKKSVAFLEDLGKVKLLQK